MNKKIGWYEKRKYVSSIGRRVAPMHRVAALKGTNAQRDAKRRIYYTKTITSHSDVDKDGVPDVKDCKPYDAAQQDLLKKVREYKIKSKQIKDKMKEEKYEKEIAELQRQKQELEKKAEMAEKIAKEREEIAELQRRYKKTSDKQKKSRLAYKIKTKAVKAVKDLGKEAQKYLMEEEKKPRKRTKRKK